MTETTAKSAYSNQRCWISKRVSSWRELQRWSGALSEPNQLTLTLTCNLQEYSRQKIEICDEDIEQHHHGRESKGLGRRLHMQSNLLIFIASLQPTSLQ